MGGTADIIIYILLFLSLYFEVFLLITFFERKHKKESKKAFSYFPSVAIIVPCYNEEHTLSQTIESLLLLSYPKEKLEIVIVNDGSIDNTAAIAEEFSKYKQVTVYHKENGGKHTALNLGIAKSSSEFVGCLDADSHVVKGALVELLSRFTDKNTAAVTPAIKVSDAQNVIEYMQKAEYMLSIFFRHIFSLIATQFVTPGPLSLYRRSVLDKIGYFKAAHNTEDMEMALRIQSNHYHIENAPTAHVYTSVPKTLRTLTAQRIRWTYGFLKNIIDYRNLLFKRKYGALGLFVLPMVTISIFGALYLAIYTAAHLVQSTLIKIVEIQTIGLPALFHMPQFDLFFVGISSALLLLFVIILITIVMLMFGKHISNEQERLSRAMLYYLSLYGFVAPIWLSVAVYNAIRSKEAAWK